MKPVFVDTHFLIAFLNERDADHELATEWHSRLAETPLVTTAWVLTELADGMCRSNSRGVCGAFIASLKQAGTIRVVGPDGDWWEQGLSLYRERPDKDWSLTDCISFAVMRGEDMAEALTGDRHFQQAGFAALLIDKGD